MNSPRRRYPGSARVGTRGKEVEMRRLLGTSKWNARGCLSIGIKELWVEFVGQRQEWAREIGLLVVTSPMGWAEQRRGSRFGGHLFLRPDLAFRPYH